MTWCFVYTVNVIISGPGVLSTVNVIISGPGVVDHDGLAPHPPHGRPSRHGYSGRPSVLLPPALQLLPRMPLCVVTRQHPGGLRHTQPAGRRVEGGEKREQSKQSLWGRNAGTDCERTT